MSGRTDTISVLRSVPAEAEAICRDLSEEQFRTRPGPGRWSILEILCHLRDYAGEEGLRARRMLEEDRPTLEAWDQEERAAERGYNEDDPKRVLTAVRAFWTGYAYQLENLDDAAWSRSGVHPELGEVTIASRAERAVEHGGNHLAQLRSTRSAVAP